MAVESDEISNRQQSIETGTTKTNHQRNEQKAFGLKVDVKVVDKKIILAAH